MINYLFAEKIEIKLSKAYMNLFRLYLYGKVPSIKSTLLSSIRGPTPLISDISALIYSNDCEDF